MPSIDFLKRNPNWRRRASTPLCKSQVACDGATLHPPRYEVGVCVKCEAKVRGQNKVPKLKGALPPKGQT